jgi:hypothetical protein
MLLLLLVIGLMAYACGSDESLTLASYAQGEWHCTFTPEEPLPGVDNTFVATVTADTGTSGEVAIQFPRRASVPDQQTTVHGEWTLDGTDIQARFDDPDASNVEVTGAALDAEQVRVRSAADLDEAAWVDVAVDRQDGSVAFEWTFPDPPGGFPGEGGGLGTVRCEKQ